MSTTQNDKNVVSTLIHNSIRKISWRGLQKVSILILFSLVVNHLITRESFPGNDEYTFPMEGFLSSIGLGAIIGLIAHFNFKFHKKKYSSKKIEVATIARFLISTLGYIILVYIPTYIILTLLTGGDLVFYYFLTGLLLTLLISAIGVSVYYAYDIYDLYKLSIKDGEIAIEHGAKTTLLTYENIACFFSANKIVYAVQNDGKTIATDFTLNALEEKVNDQLFFRANRQLIVHLNSIDQIEKIENGKLRVRLKSSIQSTEIGEITISRYKRKLFMDWFEQKT
ncbi:LytTR family DNA-binding domain-containing protein [Kordia sp.]|uniref:LytR/AlgR family response regulator transcription factor n=1 Tax=Kordia sp. TaxID=1965332 RepID=UPI0025BB996F|nr:LytTR family DNA-binding domain-containing protein [Kordia sp.]MCH2196252.1 LytTR family transcriptional regulator [Kordia sp.]